MRLRSFKRNTREKNRLAKIVGDHILEHQGRIVPITETDTDVVEKLLCFIYTGVFDFDFHNIVELLVAANKYRIDSLKKECEKYLSKIVTLAEAVQ